MPGIITLGVMSAGFVGLAISIVEQRERGILKRLRSTPLPPRVYIAGRAATATALTLLITLALVLVGRVAYGVRVPEGALPGLVVTLLVGTACFVCLGSRSTTSPRACWTALTPTGPSPASARATSPSSTAWTAIGLAAPRRSLRWEPKPGAPARS